MSDDLRASAARSTVLIADGQAKRATRIGDALEARGFEVDHATNGVDALERALLDAPLLVVAAHDLPLVDACRLAGLISSNPRTADARFLYLGEPLDAAAFRPGVGDQSLPATVRAEELAETVQAMLERRDELLRLDASAAEGGEGNLAALSVGELLDLLHHSARSARLELTHAHAGGGDDPGEVVIRDGEVVSACTGQVSGEKALFRMLGWREGSFRLLPARETGPLEILTPTRALLAEGTRQRVETARLATRLPAPDSRIRLSVRPAELPVGVHPLTQEVLRLLDGVERVDDVVEQCSFPDYQVLRTLLTLSERGLVSLHRSAVPHERRGQEGLFSDSQVRRLREWIRESQGRPRRPRDAKLIVSAAEPSAIDDFANLLRPVRGVTLSEELERGSIAADQLASLGRLSIDDELGVEMIHLPLLPDFEPLWPIATHGSLGIFCLLSGPVGPAVRSLEPLLGTLAGLPRRRVFHTVLLGKDDRVSPEELREHLSLFDEGALALIPLESSKEPAALLGSLFSRVVP